jgi:hypothetical protein
MGLGLLQEPLPCLALVREDRDSLHLRLDDCTILKRIG